MKVRIDFEENLEEDEIIIKCSKLDGTIQKIQEAISDITSSKQKLSFFKNNCEYYLPIEEILFFETSNSIVNVHTGNDVYTTKYRLFELEEILPKQFVRVSKSSILNIDYILSITKNITSSSLVQFQNTHKQVYVSRYYYKDLRRHLNERRYYEI